MKWTDKKRPKNNKLTNPLSPIKVKIVVLVWCARSNCNSGNIWLQCSGTDQTITTRMRVSFLLRSPFSIYLFVKLCWAVVHRREKIARNHYHRKEAKSKVRGQENNHKTEHSLLREKERDRTSERNKIQRAHRSRYFHPNKHPDKNQKIINVFFSSSSPFFYRMC